MAEKKTDNDCVICGEEADGIHEGSQYCSRHMLPPNPIGGAE